MDVYEYRYTRHKVADIPGAIDNPEKAADLFRTQMANTEQESLWVIALDPDFNVIGMNEIATGTDTAVPAEPKAIFRYAVRVNADSIVVAHYHCVNDATPSDADKQGAKTIMSAGMLLGIQVMDCLVVTDKSFVSINQVLAHETLSKMQANPEKAARFLSRALGLDLSPEMVSTSLTNVLGDKGKPN